MVVVCQNLADTKPGIDRELRDDALLRTMATVAL